LIEDIASAVEFNRMAGAITVSGRDGGSFGSELFRNCRNRNNRKRGKE
jgi:hypothetical protein